jgi:hypothetical protein
MCVCLLLLPSSATVRRATGEDTDGEDACFGKKGRDGRAKEMSGLKKATGASIRTHVASFIDLAHVDKPPRAGCQSSRGRQQEYPRRRRVFTKLAQGYFNEHVCSRQQRPACAHSTINQSFDRSINRSIDRSMGALSRNILSRAEYVLNGADAWTSNQIQTSKRMSKPVWATFFSFFFRLSSKPNIK